MNLKGFKWESLGIKENDLKKYLEKWYITQELVWKCYEVLPENMRDLTQ